MRRVCGQIKKERLVASLFDKGHGMIKIEIFTEAFALDMSRSLIIFVDGQLRVKVLCTLQRPIKASAVWVILIIPTKVPLADVSSCIPSSF